MNLEDFDKDTLYITPDENNVLFRGECFTRRVLTCNDCEAGYSAVIYVNIAYEAEELANIKDAGGTCGKCGSDNLSFKAIDELMENL